MSNPIAFMRELVAKGMSWEDAADFAERFEESVEQRVAAQLEALAPKRSSAAQRQAAYRERQRNAKHNAEHNGVTDSVIPNGDAERDDPLSLPLSPQTPLSPAHTREGIITHAHEAGEGEKPDPPIPKSKRGTRLPEDWEPTERDVQAARDEGLTDEEIQRAAREFRNFWCAKSRDATRLDWGRVWQNRVGELGERKRRDGARLASRPAYAGGGGRGVEDFASIVARRRGYGSA